MPEKVCSQCRLQKPLDAFYKANGYKDGHRGQCKVCVQARQRRYVEDLGEEHSARHRVYEKRSRERAKQRDPLYHRRKNLRRNFGLTPEQVDEMLASQGGACAICRTVEPAGKGWAVDHCHESGAVRGVLCHYCNLGLGQFKDSTDLLARAAAFLLGTM